MDKELIRKIENAAREGAREGAKHGAGHESTLPIILLVIVLAVAGFAAYQAIRMKHNIPISLNREKHQKLSTMLFVGHATATAVNAGKVYFTKNPMAINYPQWLAFAKYLYQQLKWVLLEKPIARASYVNGALYEDLEDVFKSVDETFNDFASGYVVIMD